jgi:hypothetical protein
MGNLVLTGATSGSTTIQPTDAVTATITLPSTTGTLAVNGPAFSAYLSADQSITNSVQTKILFDTEEFDTNNNFASSRFTPTVAGYYQINAASYCKATLNTMAYAQISIYKNGSRYKGGSLGFIGGGGVFNWQASTVSAVVYCNGSTDYIEIYGVISATSPLFGGASTDTYVNGSLIRSA